MKNLEINWLCEKNKDVGAKDLDITIKSLEIQLSIQRALEQPIDPNILSDLADAYFLKEEYAQATIYANECIKLC